MAVNFDKADSVGMCLVLFNILFYTEHRRILSHFVVARSPTLRRLCMVAGP